MKLKNLSVFFFNISYKDDLDLLKKVLEVYSTLTNIRKEKGYLRPRLVEVLSFYILFDYSKETKLLILQSLEIDTKNLTQINAELTKKGYLIRDNVNYHKKNLSEEMIELKGYFLGGDTTTKRIGINFYKDEGV